MNVAMSALAKKMEVMVEDLNVVALNMANAATPGFKQILSSVRAYSEGDFGSKVKLHTTLDLAEGSLKYTGRELDVAIRGKGFFVVDTPQGWRYTRKGRFYLDKTGRLCDGNGNIVLSAGGGGIVVPPLAASVSIDERGAVFVDGEEVGRLRVVDLPEAGGILPEGHGLYRYEGNPAPPGKYTVVQGALEASNVDVLRSMVDVLKISRGYEYSARLLRQMDRLNEKVLQA